QGAPQLRLEAPGAQETQQAGEISRVWSAQDYMDVLTDIPNLMELVGNPYILSFILRLLPMQGVSKSEVSLNTLYKHILDNWMEVGKRRLFSKGKSLAESAVLEEILDQGFEMVCMEYLLCLAVAVSEYQKDVSFVEYKPRDPAKWKAEEGGHGKDLPGADDPSSDGSDSDNSGLGGPRNFLRAVSSTALERGNASQRGHAPQRRNTVEWGQLVEQRQALNPVQELELDQSKALEEGPALGVTNISKLSMTTQFLADRVQKSPILKEQLVVMVRDSRKCDGTNQTLAANAITILVRSRMRFNSANLRGIKVQGANLTGGEFDSADLQGSDLRNTTLDKCRLRGARLDGAQLNEAEFGELPYIDLNGISFASAYSSDGKHYAVGFTSGSITVFNTTIWKEAYSFQGSKKSIGSLAFSPDSRLLAYGDMIGIVKTRQNAIGITVDLVSFRAHDDFISDLAFSPDGLKIATASMEEIGLWSAASGSCTWSKKGRRGGVSSIAFSPDGKLLVSGGPDKTIRLWDVTTGANGFQIASASSDKTVRVWSVRARTCEHIFTGHSDRVTSIAYSPKEQQLVSCSVDSTIRTWNSRSGGKGPIFRGHTDQVVSIAYSPDGTQFITCGRDQTLRRWDCRTATKGAVIFGRTNTSSSGMYPHSTVKRCEDDRDKPFQPILQHPLALTYRSSPLKSRGTVFAISTDGLLTATLCANLVEVQLWHKDTNRPNPSHALIGHLRRISCIVFSPDNQHIASGSIDGSIRIWDTRLGTLVCILMGNKSKVTSLAFSPAGQQIATGSEDGTVRLWDELRPATPTEETLEEVASTGRCLATFEDKNNIQLVTSVAISPSGQWVASGGEGGAVRVWYADSHDKPSVNLEGHRDPVNSIAFSPDSKHIASASDDGTVRIWDIDNRKEVRTLLHGEAVKCLVYMFSGKQLASGGGNNCKIWDVNTGELESNLHHDRAIVTIASFFDGVTLRVGTKDYKAYDWRSATAGRDTTLVSTAAFSGDSRLVASSLGGNAVHLWNTESGERRAVLSGHSSSIECLSFSPVRNLIATASSDGTVGIWDAETGEFLGRLTGHSAIVTGVRFSPKGDQIATVSMDQSLRLWNLSESEPGGRLRIEAQGFAKVGEHVAPPQAEEGTFGQVVQQGNNPHPGEPGNSLQAVEQGTGVQAAEQGNGVQAAEQGDALHVNEQGDALHVNEQGFETQMGHQNSTMEVDEEPSEKEGAPLDASNLESCYHDTSGLVHAPVYSPDGKQVSVISTQHGVLRFNTQTGATLPPLIDHKDKGMVTCIAYSPRGGRMATSSEGMVARVWDPVTGRILFKLNGHTGSVTNIAFSPFSHQVATSSTDNTVRLWDITANALEVTGHSLPGHQGSVLCVAYSPDGLFLASGSADLTIRLWDPFNEELLATVGDFAVGVKTIQWKVAQGGRLLLVTGCKETLPQVWELVKDIKNNKHELRRYWGADVDALAVSGVCIGQKHGLTPENSTLLEQRGVTFE
ncbi:hypothetical protein BGX24_003444, partial [Mortierella sp. AD032]